MCKYCELLKNVPIGEKRKSVLVGNNELPKIEIVLYQHEESSSAVIHAEYTENGWWRNLAIQIQYCPVCGEKLANDIVLNGGEI